MIGQTISYYRIVEKLGGCGMDVAYKAENVDFIPPLDLDGAATQNA